MKRWIAVASTVGLLAFAVQCKKSESAKPAPGEKVAAAVICLECKKTAELTLADYVVKEPWPKPCASCKKTSLYAYQTCANCAQPVPLKDPAANKYGYPERCPACNKRWEH